MKNDDFLMILGAAVGVFLIAKASRAKAATKAATKASSTAVKPTGANPADAGFGNLISTWNGWRYYDSGYAKDQFGNIYYQGEKIADAQWGAV